VSLRAKDDKMDKEVKGAVYVCTSPLHYSGERVIIAYFLSQFCVCVCVFVCLFVCVHVDVCTSGLVQPHDRPANSRLTLNLLLLNDKKSYRRH
jgi:hypothetical protein